MNCKKGDRTKFHILIINDLPSLVHLYFARAKHFGRQFISENQRFTTEMLRPYEYICKNEIDPPTPTKETGFSPNLWVAMKYFRKKPGFWEPAQFARYL